MKKVLITILAIIMIISVCTGCNNTENNTEKQSTVTEEKVTADAVEENTVSTETEEPAQQEAEDETATDLEIQESTEVQEVSYTQLKEGDKSDSVTNLQNRLCELGYLDSDSATGYYGTVTKRAVKRFQKTNGLQDDGIAGEKTQELLFSDSAEECPTGAYLLSGYTIGLDPGHQAKGDSTQEPVAPGSSETKKRVSSGTCGDYSGVDEYVVNLKVALILRDMLEEEGADVIMTHTTADVNISNKERAQIFNEAETDYALRIHCNGVEDHSKNGAFVIVPTENPYLSDCKTAAQILIDEYCSNTDFANRGTVAYSDQTGFNWCDRMIINIEMGYMSNEHDDMLLTDSDYQYQMAEGIFNGIVEYFEQK